MWGKAPGWFATLDRGAQARLLAEYRLTTQPRKPVDAAAPKAARAPRGGPR